MKTHARQLILFVFLAYAISWLIWLPGILSMNGDYQLGNFGVSPITFALLYPLTLIAFSFAMTKLWHWTRGSVLTAVLFHAVLNYATGRIIDPQRFDLASRSSLGVYLIAVVAFAALALAFWVLDAWAFGTWKGSGKNRDAAV